MIVYALYYKDKDGFDIILNESTGQLLTFTNKKSAEEALIVQKSVAHSMWRPEAIKETRGMLWWKNTVELLPKINPIESAIGRQIFTTADIKKVKVI